MIENELPVEQAELDELASLMTQKHTASTEGRRFSIALDQQDTVTQVTVSLANDDETFVYPVEGRLHTEDEEMTSRQAALFLCDYIDLYFEDYFDGDENLFLPIDWSDYEYEAVRFQLRGQVVNRKAELLADSLLAGEKH